MSIQIVPIDQPIPHPNNPRLGNTKRIKDSIKEHGFYGAIILQAGTNHILAGNHRWKAAKEAGLKHISVQIMDVTDEQAAQILLIDNKASDDATYNKELQKALDTITQPEPQPEPQPPTGTQEAHTHSCPNCNHNFTPKPHDYW